MKSFKHISNTAIKTMLMAAMLFGGKATAQVVVKGNVFGGGNEGPVGSDSEVLIETGTVEKDVYGGGNLAEVSGSVKVTMTGGTVVKDVYGGGALANTNTGTGDAKTTTVDLKGGVIKGDAYGGGLGRLGTDAVTYTAEDAEVIAGTKQVGDVKTPAVEAVEAKVYGDVTVNLGGAASEVKATEIQKSYYTGEHAGVVKSGRVFGCNNLSGSPQGDVTVNIYKTATYNDEGTANEKPAKNNSSYEVAAVYGGGNLSNYEPAVGKKTKVIIHTCDVSVESVYGGGNAAAVPETDVLVDGAYEIHYVFGGGNGKDPYTLDGGTNWINNAGADVGGNTKVLLQDGYIHEAYGGSNEKGTVSGTASLNTGKTEKAYPCGLNVIKLVGAGKNADIDGDAILVLGCMPEAKVDEIYGGADNANVNGNVELTITSGNFGKVFGGNNRGGLIKGHIILNIEETSCRAINIDELYLGGNEAAYSIYGYYDSGETDQETNKPIYLPRVSENDSHTAVDNPSNADGKHPFPYADPILNVISCTRIGRVFGGGYGEGAALYGNPTVNLNMIPGAFAAAISREGTDAAHRLGEIGGTYTKANNEEVDGGVFGGGDGAAVYGNTTVNIGTATTVQMTSVRDEEGELLPTQPTRNVEGAYINCNIYGGGNEANVYGNTQVNICAIDDPSTTDVDYSSVTINGSGYEGVTIKGDVFGGGKGVADNFFCNKAMVGEDGAGANADKYPNGYPDGNTNVIIGNGTVEGTVYGGGEIGRVEMNTTVTIGLQEGTSSPTIKGNVFGAGKGLETHGYAALVRGNPTVTVQGHAKVEQNVYGGGEIASVARYKLVEESDLNKPEFVAAHPGLGVGMPYALAEINGVNTGNCTVIVRGYAEVGTEAYGGNVFGAGQGILPYYDNSNEDKSKRSRRMMSYNSNTYNESNTNWEFADDAHQNVWEYFPTVEKYIEFIQTQALSSQTNVTVSGDAIVRGSVYGGSENGVVQFDAHVSVTGGTIGVGQKGGVTFGNVFGAGKGYVDTTRPENLLAGIVRGNTEVTITDGSILHNVYGGGAYGSVGTITPGSVTYVHVPGQESVSNMPVSWARKTESATSYNTGTATIKITGGTIGVDGHEDGMVFGSSRGDVGAPGNILDHQAWVYETHVIIGDSEHPGNTTTPLIRGSIYGSGENGHVFTNTVVDIYGGTIGLTTAQSTDPEGYTGADYLYRGNVYGGGCGTDKYYASGTAPEGHTLTDGKGDTYNALSGCVLGNATINITGGHVVHNVYGAGAMGSVGRTDITNNVPTTTGGKTTITISGGRIGDDGVGDGNVYGAARGGEGISNDLAHVRETEVTINYSTTPDADNSGRTEQLIAGSVFGGGEAGTVKESVAVNMKKGLILHDVYGGGALADTQTSNWDATNSTWADATNKSSVYTTQVKLEGGRIIGDLYGGGLGRLADTEANPAVDAIEAKVYGDVTVTTTSGKVARVFGCNNLNGAPQGKVAVNINGTDDITGTTFDYAIGNVYGGGNQAAYSYADASHPLTVTMAGGIVNNVFGGGLSADVAGSIAVNVTGGQVINDVYGGGALAHTNTANWNQGNDPLLKYVEVTGLTEGTTSVAGYYTKSGDVYTLITADDKAEAGKPYYKKVVGGNWKTSHPHTTTVDLTGGVVGNVYGGGLGRLYKAAVAAQAAQGTEGEEGYVPAVEGQDEVTAVEAMVYGDVTVSINEGAAPGVAFMQRPSENFTIGNSTIGHTVSLTGHVYGCNNLNGTPTGDVKVHVFKTRYIDVEGNFQNYHVPTEDETETYEIQGVYGGGNLADYLPAEGKKTSVQIDGCGVTSIKKVYGGGNSAVVPTTDVLITGSYAIGYAFGGGNGGEYIKKNGVWQENEGAIVIGTATIACKGGKVGSVFGGSDAKGVCGGVNIDTKAYTDEGSCPLVITRLYGAGNEADVNGHVNMILASCSGNEIEYVHGGSYNANITGDVILTITSGIFRNVYGGNDARGSIGGDIIVNIEETENCGKPIIIQNLVGGGNNAPYPGTKRDGTHVLDENNNPRHGKITVNVKSATRIDNVYGGCFNAEADADTEVNINMLKGNMAGKDVTIPILYQNIPNITTSSSSNGYITCKIDDAIGTIGNVFGGGNEGKVIGDATVNIGTVSQVPIMRRNEYNQILDENGAIIEIRNEQGELVGFDSGQMLAQNIVIGYQNKPVLGANITENVYGGGKLADVTGNTFVNICTPDGTTSVAASVASGVTIAGNVFGGGKGADDTFKCEKAMIGTDGAGVDANFNDKPDYTDGNTNVIIANGTVGTLEDGNLVEGTGNVYGGGEIGRVEKNSTVTIGLGDGVPSTETATSAPVIYGDVFGAGKGVETHGYSALVRGNPTAIIQGNAKVRGSVYGGGEIASVARYDVRNGSPVALANNTSGFCNVTVKGYAEIGPNNMQMTKSGGPDFSGNVFGAGKGVLPKVYTYVGDDRPHRMLAAAQIATISSSSTYSYSGEKHDNIWEAFGNDADYHAFIETLALSSQTNVTIGGHAFVKGSVYGGSENGIVQYDTHVTIEGNCQIGCGANTTVRYDEDKFIDPTTTTVTESNALAECAHWLYGKASGANKYAPYDKFAGTAGYDSRGGRTTADDGHTFYGNVFGGGSGYFPYAPGKWHRAAGIVRGNTNVDITGGHILTSVYGGNEQTDVGTYTEDENHEPIVYKSGGKCTVNFGGNATLGVPRTRDQIIAHPVTCYLYGAGKGDTRTFFNTWTNVNETEVNVTGGIIYGSVLGGGEDGHVLGNVKLNISDDTSETPHINTKIGTWGTSYVDGNVFGAGRGFTGEALTAGSIGGNVTMNISGGTMLGSVYGGGRMASVGIGFTDPGDTYYGQLIDDETGDNPKTYGHIVMNIIGGTIGNENATGEGAEHSGNVFGGSMGRIDLLNGMTNELWPKLAVAKTTAISISGIANIKNNVYGGGEIGIVRNEATVNVSGGTVNGSVFGGGYGSDDYTTKTTITPAGYSGTYYTFIPLLWAGCVSGNTNVNVSGGTVKKNVYGGGELASVGLIDFVSDAGGNFTNMPKHTDLTNSFGLSWPYEFHYHAADSKDTSKDGKATVTITGNSKIGTDNDDNTGYVFGGGKGQVAFGTTDDIDEQRYTEAFCANARETKVTIGTTSDNEQPTIRTVYGGGEDGHVYENATVIINDGTIGHSVFGGGKGESQFITKLWDRDKEKEENDEDKVKDYSGTLNPNGEAVYSWTAGKVYGNTSVTMNDGSVGWFIYGGGNLASVGKGNYSGGSDDYYSAGYGENPPDDGSLWTNTDFLNSGNSTVTILGGTVGTETSGADADGIPYGSVFGGSRGKAAMDVGQLSPRYKYLPDFFLGYVNNTFVNFGGTTETGAVSTDGPTIYGSLYGGGQDGHVRNSAEIRIFKGSVKSQTTTGDEGRSGNVFGAGSGIGTFHDSKDGQNKCSYASGSVTCRTLVEVNDGTIDRCVYGGGAMASVGPPKIGPSDEQKEVTASSTKKSCSHSLVDIKGGTIHGSVFGGSRGPSEKFRKTHFDNLTNVNYDPSKFSTDIYADVIISGNAIIEGDVYGGGETGYVKGDVRVNILGGSITKDVYGGGALAHTNTGNLKQDKDTKKWGWTDTANRTAKYTTTVNLLGGTIGGDAYGGGLGRKEYGTSNQSGYVSPVEALVFGDVKVNLNGVESEDYDASIHGGDRLEQMYGGYQIKDDVKGAIVTRVFGCNNLNGSPQGKVRVHVFATQNKDAGHNKINLKYPIPTPDNGVTNSVYDVAAVYGGANLAVYTPMGPDAVPGTDTDFNELTTDYKKTEQRSEVIIDGCHRTSIKQVYGGGNAASAPATYVEVNGTYEIDEVFGGGNGADNYTLVEGGVPVWYQNPGANVGYKNYTHKVISGTAPGTEASPYYLAVEDEEYDTPEERKTAAAAAIIRYGSGIATTAIKGGKIHNVYGGSNKKGNISTTALSLYESMNDDCPIDIDQSYGGGKDAKIDGDIVTRSQCAHGVKELFGGSKNADVNSDVVLTITNGSSYERVFGGNNTSGAINGSITVNIEEGGCEPIKIKELYAGGYLAPYSVYGYETNDDGTYKTESVAYLDENNVTQYQTQCIPLTSGDNPKKDPRINVISATQIDNIFGGGYQAKVVGDPHINVNMTNGKVEVENKGTVDAPAYKDADGNTYETFSSETTYYATVNEVKMEVQKVEWTSGDPSTNDYIVSEGGKTYVYKRGNTCYKVGDVTSSYKYWATLDIGTIGNIYGGGNLADIVGDTYVEIGTGKWLTWDENGDPVWEESTPVRNAATITGNVFGGGKGKADNYTCDKAMVGVENSGEGSTHVLIENGTVGSLDENGKLVEGTGNVYGGGMIGRVEKDTEVTIGKQGDTTNELTINGNVFGAGQGVATHGYSGLTRGNSVVTIQGKAKVIGSVYGGGQKASVGRFYVKDINDGNYQDRTNPKYAHVPKGMPYARISGGKCTVTIQDDAEIGPDNMKMNNTTTGKPDDAGHVFGAGKGIIPYVDTDTEEGSGEGKGPGRWYTNNNVYTWQSYAGDNNENNYLEYIETLALADETDVTIKDNAFVKGSVFGGSENGIVLDDTHVTIKDHCQIGNGDGVNRRYITDEWTAGHLIQQNDSETELVATYNESLPECASWPYGVIEGTRKIYTPYDKFANASGYYDNSNTISAGGGRPTGSDGSTFYGNVFGGGSGYYPYKAGKWHRAAGAVRGNAVVDILGGHILSSIYGGNQMTDVGTYVKDGNNDNEPLIPVAGTGKCTINMVGGTLGVPRTLAQIAAHPVTCYVFGAGKGDPRTFFNTWTNVIETEVNISGNARIYGSTFGGGEDGHVIYDAETNIGGSITIGETTYTQPAETSAENPGVLIGTTGTSYVDGNIFGAGRGFSGHAITAGSVGGNVEVNIKGGTMLGSVYGGGRLASVGIGFNAPTDSHYGQYTEDGAIYYTQEEIAAAQVGDPAYGKTTNNIKVADRTYGHVTVNISGGTIGNDSEHKSYIFNVDTKNRTDAEIEAAKEAALLAQKNTDGIPNTDFELYKSEKVANSENDTYKYYYRILHTKGGNVFGGSMGRLKGLNDVDYLSLWPQLGQSKTATVNITGGTIKSNVYGGAEMGTVRDNTYVTIGGTRNADGTITPSGLPTIGRDVYGGGYGSIIHEAASKGVVETLDNNNNILHFGYTPMQWAGCVGKGTEVNVKGGWIKKNVYGGGEMASVGIFNYILDEIEYDTEAAVPADKVLFRQNPTNNKYSVYKNIVKHADETTSFALSWPYQFEYFPGYDGTVKINITGGRLGVMEDDDVIGTDNGDVYGGGKGVAGDYKEYIFCGNVGSTEININYDPDADATTLDPATYKEGGDCVAGALYGGAENGHVMGDTKVTLTNGLIGHSLYGGGSGKGQFTTWLTEIPADRRTVETPGGSGTAPATRTNDGKTEYKATCYSITAGKVFGNTEIEMTGGYVVRNIYGGGNMGSVGKGNYAGGPDDYSTAGYGEKLPTGTNLWDNKNKFSTAFLHSGKCKVTVTGGTVGYVNPTYPSKSMYPLNDKKEPYDASLPYGNIFGGCRGEAAPNILESPRYLYCPEFFVGYANETEITVGTSGQDNENAGEPDKAPRIWGSVYGGGQDGHIRRDATLTINSGEIGLAYTKDNRQMVGTLTKDNPTQEQINSTVDLDNLQWLARGNVYGAGSGIGKYKYDFNYDGDFGDVIGYTRPGAENATTMKEEDNSTSAGSVTRFTTVNINGGIIHRNVYGGGSLSSVGAPKIPPITIDPYRKGDTAEGHGVGMQSLNQVNIAGTIGTPQDYQAHYGGEVYGASRGNPELGESFSTSVWTEVNIKDGAHIQGNVFGGGDNGPVKRDAEVNIGEKNE